MTNKTLTLTFFSHGSGALCTSSLSGVKSFSDCVESSTTFRRPLQYTAGEIEVRGFEYDCLHAWRIDVGKRVGSMSLT